MAFGLIFEQHRLLSVVEGTWALRAWVLPGRGSWSFLAGCPGVSFSGGTRAVLGLPAARAGLLCPRNRPVSSAAAAHAGSQAEGAPRSHPPVWHGSFLWNGPGHVAGGPALCSASGHDYIVWLPNAEMVLPASPGDFLLVRGQCFLKAETWAGC